ncbi:MAG: ThiF family adenylyltransferase [Acidobacteriaceae bacterium]
MARSHIVVAGAGGNTGSHLLPHLGRMPGVARMTLVDPDVYESANLAVQNIESADVGEPKVKAQAARLRRIRPDLDVAAIHERIENVPRGLLRCDLLVSCLDSKAARQHLNEIAWRMGTPMIDCGVLGSQNLVRVNAYAPSEDSPCLECSWDSGEYAMLEQMEYLCGAAGAEFPSMASSAMGGLAAALTAIEIAKILRGEGNASVTGRQVVLDAEHHVVQVTAERRNPECRFDHGIWAVEPWISAPEATTLAEAVSALGSVRVEGHRFVSELVCPGCGRRENGLRLNRPLARCAACDRRMASDGFGAREWLDSTLAIEYRGLTLAQVGLRTGDIVSSGERHRLLVGAA